jgi:hypothetical protein
LFYEKRPTGYVTVRAASGLLQTIGLSVYSPLASPHRSDMATDNNVACFGRLWNPQELGFLNWCQNARTDVRKLQVCRLCFSSLSSLVQSRSFDSNEKTNNVNTLSLYLDIFGASVNGNFCYFDILTHRGLEGGGLPPAKRARRNSRSWQGTRIRHKPP